ncbi:MAG: hypothetical protein DLM72_05395 [Candidatus Nitrosopolaris wilkensis]|nr:MAG: hypothetical protein DLM72_05395 [Candidatus Nitrosopolaris wilkensis]
MTYTIAGLVLTGPWLSITLKLNANTASAGTPGAVNVGVAVLAPVNVTDIPLGNCVHWYATIIPPFAE